MKPTSSPSFPEETKQPTAQNYDEVKINEAELLNKRHHLVVGKLKASGIGDARRILVVVLAITIIVVTMERPDVDENATRLKTAKDDPEVSNKVRCGVEEKTAATASYVSRWSESP
ncbi:unnamed protein product [Parascedosporium putredinis]|uniref:Uncharacterized protein n=1 Tax=Parascedosporium putredinis TaxID=1442378 RepID=A0A9P1GZ53_9PEZI|nr:unnamed protein product [Parascedosporium putredinis]CAI7991418.1 unnamed protein product [Parascedosporium putredinis]